MKYLCSSDNAPVIPWFPAPPENVFLAIGTWEKQANAYVRSLEFDLDLLLEELCTQYPGLPRVLLTNYLLETALLASKLPDGRRVRVFVTDHSTSIQDADTDEVYTLWDTPPMKPRL